MFSQLVVGGHLLLFVTRTECWFFLPPFPATPLVVAILLTQVVAVLMCGFGWLVPSIPWTLIGWVWVYNIAWMFVLGGVRLRGSLTIAFASIEAFGTTFLHAEQAQEMTLCDALAPSDHYPKAKDLYNSRFDAPAAIAACEEALAERPGIARLQHRYAIALWRAKRRGEAMAWLRRAADQSYAPAQADLAYAYRDDPGVSGYRNETETYAEAFRLSRLAAEQGNIIAFGDVGYCYQIGRGVERDYGEALKWLLRGVEHDQRFAESHLGEMYKNGWGVPQDDVEAVKWFRRSADQGYRGGQYNLALMLLAGRGVSRDPSAAEKLLSRAAEQEHSEARLELEKLRLRQ
jgi:TPR repeat protein